MFVTPEIMEVVNPQNWTDDEEGIRFSRLRADIDHFTQGGRITICEGPYNKPKSTYLARTDPITDEVWDIRSRDPRPGIRVLGSFSECNTFVALVWSFREPLQGPGSREWRDFILRCKARWNQLFGTYQPLSGASVSDYVSTNYTLVQTQ